MVESLLVELEKDQFRYRQGGEEGWPGLAPCAASIGVAVHPGTKAAKLIKDLGGVKQAARLFIGAGRISDIKKMLPGAAESIIGIAAIKQNCKLK